MDSFMGYSAYDDYGIFGDQTDKAVKITKWCGTWFYRCCKYNDFKAILNTDPYVLSSYGGDANIRFIQQTLNKCYNKYFDLIPCNGIYERATNKALVCALGAEEGLAASVITGTFGPSTTANCPSLKYGDTRTNFVALLQFVLYCNGYLRKDGILEEYTADPERFNGVYDSYVQTEVTKFQEFMCLKVSGDADKGTMMSLFTSCGDPDRSAKGCDTATRLNATTAKTITNAGYKYIGRYLTNAKSGTG